MGCVTGTSMVKCVLNRLCLEQIVSCETETSIVKCVLTDRVLNRMRQGLPFLCVSSGSCTSCSGRSGSSLRKVNVHLCSGGWSCDRRVTQKQRHCPLDQGGPSLTHWRPMAPAVRRGSCYLLHAHTLLRCLPSEGTPRDVTRLARPEGRTSRSSHLRTRTRKRRCGPSCSRPSSHPRTRTRKRRCGPSCSRPSNAPRGIKNQ